MRLIRIAELTVNLIRNEEQVVLAGDFTYGEHVFLGIQCAARVAGVADEYRPCPVGYRLLELFDRRDLKAVPDVCRDGLEGYAVQESESVVVRVERLEHYHFVSGIACYLEGEIDTLASGNCYDDFRHFNVNAYFPVVFFHESLSQLHDSCGMGV